jgi:glycosyltransferase involved in cell wall biosynthesis
VVGDGPYIEELKYRVRGTKAIFTGYLCGEELARAYASSDIFVLPSSTDTFGNVVLEAQASGLPVIVSDKGGPRENIILGETGLIFKSEDTVDLVRCIKELVDNVHRRNNMGSRAHYFMKRRSLVKMVESTWNLYQNLIPSSERYWVAG